MKVDHAPSRWTRHLVFDNRQMQMETEVTKESVVCGHHTYKEVWQPVIGIKCLLSRIYAVRKEKKKHAPDRWGTLNNKVHLINQFYSINIIINGWLLKMRDK